MIKTDAPLFGRVVTAMVSPFKDDLSLDFKAVDAIVDHLIATGTDTIVVSGTTGESPTLEDKEKNDLLRAVISRNNGRAKVIAGTGSNSTAKTVKLSEEAESLGADGLLIVAPYYNKPSQDGLIAHYEAVCKAVSLPIILYNIPGRTGININVETICELSNRFAHIHAVKDSTGNVDQAAEIALKATSGIRVYSGDDFLTLPYLSVGACGVISVASHVAGEGIKKMINAYFAGNVQEATALHLSYLPLFRGLFSATNPACTKHALSGMGLCKPHLRLPLVGLSQEQKKTLDGILKQASMQTACATTI